jgi:serine/threonine protein kinase
LAEALSYVHRLGAVHCDIKPQNILLDSREMPRLTDFGQARGQGPRGSSLGTRFYMPPEQARLGAPDPRWDVYALGALLYQMLTGTKPRHSSGLATEQRGRTHSASEIRDELEKYAEHLERSRPPHGHRGIEGVTSEVANLIEQCLSNDSQQRPKDASELLKLIARCESKRRRRPLLILGGVAPALTLLVAGLIVIFGGLWALKNFGRRWITQVLTDNQIVAQTIATEFEARFNDRLKVVREEADDPDWLELLAQSPNSHDRTISKLMHLFEIHGEQRLKRWTLVNLRSGRALTYGKLPSGKEGIDECDNVENAMTSVSKGPMLSIPHRRQSNEPENVLWVLCVSSAIRPGAKAPAAGDLSAEIDYHDFNDVFARVAGSAFFKREIIVANEEGRLLYHQRLAEAVKGEQDTEVRCVDLKKPDNQFFAEAFAPGGPPLPASGGMSRLIHRDPWYKDEDPTEYFVSRTAANLVNGQKVGVFVLHDKEIALAGFVQAQRGAQALGLSLLAVGCVMLVGNLWMLRRTLREEGSSQHG